VDTVTTPLDGGTTTGDGTYLNDTSTTVLATPSAGYAFVNWSENGKAVCSSASYTFTNIVNRSLVAHFIPAPQLSVSLPQPRTMVLAWPTNFSGFLLQENPDLATTNWTRASDPVGVVGTNYQATNSATIGARFLRLYRP
jgi:hypothetical protein